MKYFEVLLKEYFTSSRGVAAIEFAFIFPVFLALVFGCIELGYILWAKSALNYGASYGARYAFVNPTASSGQIKTAAENAINFPTSGISYTVTASGTAVDITGSFSYAFLVLPMGSVTLTTQAHQVLPLTS